MDTCSLCDHELGDVVLVVANIIPGPERHYDNVINLRLNPACYLLYEAFLGAEV